MGDRLSSITHCTCAVAGFSSVRSSLGSGTEHDTVTVVLYPWHPTREQTSKTSSILAVLMTETSVSKERQRSIADM
jgi:hypothetical protein